MGCGACLEESSMLPTRSARGSLFIAGVDGGGQVFELAGLGVAAALSVSFTTTGAFVVPFKVEIFPSAAGRFSFSASRPLAVSRDGAPSMN
jgi:hypothetical protein